MLRQALLLKSPVGLHSLGRWWGWQPTVGRKSASAGGGLCGVLGLNRLTDSWLGCSYWGWMRRR